MTNYPRAFIQKIFGEEKIWALTQKYQKKAGIDFKKMDPVSLVAILQDKKKYKRLWDCFKQYFSEIQKMTSYEAYISRVDFSHLLFKLFVYGGIEAPDEDSIWSVFDIVTIIDNKKHYVTKEYGGKPNKNIEDGIYIKVGPINSLSEIIEYVNKNKDCLSSAQDSFINIKKKEYPKIRESAENFSLNRMIDVLYSKEGKEILNKTSEGETKYKSYKIKDFLGKLEINKNPETIERQYRRREKIKRTLTGQK